MLILAAFGVFIGWRWARLKARNAESEAAASGLSFYTQTGGARIGSFNATVPFATIVATPSNLTLSVFGRQHHFDKSSVVRLSRYRFLFSTGLRIEHQSDNSADFVVFWTTNFEKLAKALEQFGWPVNR